MSIGPKGFVLALLLSAANVFSEFFWPRHQPATNCGSRALALRHRRRGALPALPIVY